MKNTHEECKGCQYIPYNKERHIKCLIRYENELRQHCPCRTCIIKMICKNMCRQRHTLYSERSSKRKTLLAQLTLTEEINKIRNEKHI